MNIRFFNARICTLEKDFKITHGEIWIEDGLVKYVGDGKDVKKINSHSEIKFHREIDSEGNLILPGFKNAHTHSAMTFLRSYADDMPLLDWLYHQVFPMENKLLKTNDSWVKTLSKLAIMEYLSSGITLNCDMYMPRKQIVDASIETGFRTTALAMSGGNGKLEKEYLWLRDIHPLINTNISFHAEYTATDDIYNELIEVSKKYNLPIYTHIAESKREVDECIERTGKTPIKHMIDKGLFRYGGVGYHCVHLTDDDVDIFKKHKIDIVTNPGSNVKLASGIAPVEEYIKKGIQVGIGTDGPASNNSLDMFWEMKLTSTMQKIINNNAASMPADKVLEMACKTGADICGVENSNSLAVGKNADLVMINLNMPNMQPLNNIIKNVVYAGSKINVKMTMVAGKILYEDGKFNIGVDEKEIYKEVNEIVKALKNDVIGD